MTRASEASPAARSRGLGLVTRANRWMATGAVVLTAAFSIAAAKEFHSSSSASNSNASSNSTTSSTSSLQSPTQKPSSTSSSSTSGVVSGGS